MSAPDEHGIHICSYCGVRYHVAPSSAAGPPVIVVEARSGQAAGAVMAIVGAAVLLLLVGGGVAWMLVSSKDDAAVADASNPPARRARASSSPSPTVVEVGPAPKPEPAEPATAEFELHGTRSGHETSFYVLGYVTNTSPFPIRQPKLTVVLLDEDGREVGTKSGFAEDDVVEPGERTPASVLVKDPPPHASLTVEVAPRRADYIAAAVSGLEIEAGEPRRGSLGSALEVSGRVIHSGTEAAKFIKVRVLGFDADGKLMGVYFTYADTDRLEPGASARFSTSSMFFDAEPARFELQVTGRAAD